MAVRSINDMREQYERRAATLTDRRGIDVLRMKGSLRKSGAEAPEQGQCAVQGKTPRFVRSH